MFSRDARGFTLIELLIVCLLIGLLAALGAPYLMAAKSSSNEASAIGSLRAINSAETAYSSTCGANHFTTSVATLISRDFLSEDMGFNPKSGFNFAIAIGAAGVPGPADCTGGGTVSAYYATGTPLSVSTGRRAFATSAAGVIWQDTNGTPPPEPFTPGPTISPIQ